MPKKSPVTYMNVDLDSFCNAAKEIKSNTSSSAAKGAQVSLSPGSADGSETKTPEQTAQEALQRAVDTGMAAIRQNVNRRIINQAIMHQVRERVAAEYSQYLSPAEIDRFAQEAANKASYKYASEMMTLPPNMLLSSFIVSEGDGPMFTDEPGDMIDDPIIESKK